MTIDRDQGLPPDYRRLFTEDVVAPDAVASPPQDPVELAPRRSKSIVVRMFP